MSDTGFPDLRAFLDQLRRDGELRVVEAEVDPRLEAAEIHRRVIAAGGPALLFTRVRGSELPLVTNLFGTARRAELAFGRRPGRLIRRLVELAETLVPPTPAKLWGARDVAAEILRIGLKRTSGGPVTELVTRDVRLDRLPVLTCWPERRGAVRHAAARVHGASGGRTTGPEPTDRRDETERRPTEERDERERGPTDRFRSARNLRFRAGRRA